MTTRIKLRRDTAANWLAANPILAAGEPGLETDSGKIKYGDGTSTWSLLSYGGSDTLADDGSVVVTAGSTEHWVATQRRDSYDTEPRGVRYDSLGNLYTLTRANDESASGISIITKYTAAGAVAWQKSITGFNPVTLAVDSSDCAYATGWYGGPGITIVKFSSTGTILWKKDYDIGPIPAVDAYVEEKSSSTMIVAYSIFTTDNFPNTAVVMEISNSDGSVLVKKQLAQSNTDYLVYVSGIDVDPSENVFVTGGYYDNSEDKNKMFVEKLDDTLERVWTKSIESDNTYDMSGGDCASDALGNIYVVGAYSVDAMNTNIEYEGQQSAGILTKLNSNGVTQWTRRIGPGPCGSFTVGLTATVTGDVYLSAMTFAKKTNGQEANAPEGVQENYGDNKLIVARYTTDGAVVWQRYVDITKLYEFESDFSRGQAVSVFGDKFAVDGWGYSWETTPFSAADSNANEASYFVAQLPTDGTALTIGDLNFIESRVPARFITLTAVTSPLLITTYAETILAEVSEVTLDEVARVANNIVKSETYDYTFGADGTLTIPNDGDLQLTQTQVGYLAAIGGSVRNGNDLNGRAVAVDDQGYMYVGGEDQSNYQPFITKIAPDGTRVWGVSVYQSDNDPSGRVNGIAIDPVTKNVAVLCEMYPSYIETSLTTLDQDTGRVLAARMFRDTDADVYLNDIAYTSTGTYVLAGSKMGEFSQEYTITKQSGSTTGVINMLRSDVPTTPDSWQIGGTGFSVFENVAYINRYSSLTGTTRQGSGATFNITIGGDGSVGSVTVNAGGTNYLVGHKILIDHAVFDGSDNNSDVIITVTAATNGVIETVAAGYYGSGGGAPGTYTAASGTNTQVGSGFVLDFSGPLTSNNYNDRQTYSVTTAGTNYVENDIIVFDGANLGGVTTTNDLTVRVSVSGSGVAFLHEIAGTSQSTIWKISTTTQVDFSGSGTWMITYPTDRQNFIATPTWQRTFGIPGDGIDRLYAVAVDSGNNIIAVGQSRGDLELGANNYDIAAVFKFNSAGAIQWSRQLNEIDYNCYAKSVTTIGTDIYVTHNSTDSNDTIITKLNAAGTIKWQERTDSNDDSVIAATADGNLLVAVEAYYENIGESALKVFLMTPSGEVIYKRWISAAIDEGTQFKNGRGLAVDSDSFYVTAYFNANGNNSSIAARLPLDGTGTGEHGSFRYAGVDYMSGSFMEDGINITNYDIDTLDITAGNNYAGPLVTAPYINTATTVTSVEVSDFYVDSHYPDWNVEAVRDMDGGRIVFADGTTQNTSATEWPQRLYTGQAYTLGLKDRGHHIYMTGTADGITIPYYARVAFPIGTVIHIVNGTSNGFAIYGEGTNIYLQVAGTDAQTGGSSVAFIGQYAMATLLMVGRDSWVITGLGVFTTP